MAESKAGLVDFKIRKFEWEFHTALGMFESINPPGGTFDWSHSHLHPLMYMIDNCVSSLYSIWEGMMSEVEEYAETQYSIPQVRRTDLTKILRANDDEMLAKHIEDAWNTDVRLWREIRNDYTHSSVMFIFHSFPSPQGGASRMYVKSPKHPGPVASGFFEEAPIVFSHLIRTVRDVRGIIQRKRGIGPNRSPA